MVAVTETSRPLGRAAGPGADQFHLSVLRPHGVIDNSLEELSLYRSILYRKSRLLVRIARPAKDCRSVLS